MKFSRKIQAFTLSEMIVVIILTSVVVGLAFSVLSLVQKQLLGIQSNFQTNTDLSLFEQSLWLDFNRYNDVRYNAIEDVLEFKTQIDSVSYTFLEGHIIKDSDTFKIPLKVKAVYFNGTEIETGTVDAIKLEAIETMQNKQLFIFRSNTAKDFMN